MFILTCQREYIDGGRRSLLYARECVFRFKISLYELIMLFLKIKFSLSSKRRSLSGNLCLMGGSNISNANVIVYLCPTCNTTYMRKWVLKFVNQLRDIEFPFHCEKQAKLTNICRIISKINLINFD